MNTQMHTIQYTKETQKMITLREYNKSIEVHFEGTLSDVAHEVWAILEGYRHNVGTESTLKFIESYLNHINDELEGEHHD